MSYRSLQECVADLERIGQLVRVPQEVDPHLEAAEIQRRVYRAGGPAVLLERVRGTPFPALCNLFGTLDRVHYLFRHTLPAVRRLAQWKVDPTQLMRRPWQALGMVPVLARTRPKVVRNGPVLRHSTSIEQLPQIQCWPKDGGAFITLPLVYSEDPNCPCFRHSNLGMYRIQLSGGEYRPGEEVGLHYQIHRGIGPHHQAALFRGEPLRVSVWVGGPPAMTVAAVMPLPEGFSELMLAGVLGGRRVRMIRRQGEAPIWADADFCLVGEVVPERLLPEGPFGDHLGYYSLAHPFPVLRVRRVYHRPGAIWPFTVVGRPPQEDTTFGQFIHELVGPVVSSVVPGVREVHAVDAAGVHPLLLAVGSERYEPFRQQSRPQELLTQANALLGQGQMSLAKYLWIAAREDDPELSAHDVPRFFQHVLARVDWTRDLHFQTCTTIDTLDYSGTGLNEGSKLVVAAVGPARRKLSRAVPEQWSVPPGFGPVRVAMPGVLVLQGPRFTKSVSQPTAASLQSSGGALAGGSFASTQETTEEVEPQLALLCRHLESQAEALAGFPLVVVVDDVEFAAASLENFLWVTFTRSDPAQDVHGAGAFVRQKHWGCRGPLVIDARCKPHHAPVLEADPEVTRRVDRLFAPGGPLHGIE